MHDQRAKGRERVDAAAGDLVHARHAAGQADGEQVHHQPRVDAGAESGHPVFFCHAVNLFCQLRLFCGGIAHLLCGADGVDSAREHLNELGIDILRKRIGRNNANIRALLRQDRVDVAVYDYICAIPARQIEKCKDTLADAIGVQITNARDFHARLLQKHLCDAAAHRAKSPNCYPDISHTVPPAFRRKKIEVLIYLLVELFS